MPWFRLPSSATVVTPFAEGVISADLPGLDPGRRRSTIDFVVHRIDTLPSVTHLGVLIVATMVRGVLTMIPVTSAMGIIARLPLIGEYLRLVRSLSLAYVFETWPATRADGGDGGG